MTKMSKKILVLALMGALAIVSVGCTTKTKEIERKASNLERSLNEKGTELEDAKKDAKEKESKIKELQNKLEEKPEVIEKIIQSEEDIKKEIDQLQEIQDFLDVAYIKFKEMRYDYYEVEKDRMELYVEYINYIEDIRYNEVVPIIYYTKENKYDNTDELFEQKQHIAEEVEKNCFYLQTMYYLDGIDKGYSDYLDKEIESRNVQRRNIFDIEEFERCEKAFLKKDKSLASIFEQYEK